MPEVLRAQKGTKMIHDEYTPKELLEELQNGGADLEVAHTLIADGIREVFTKAADDGRKELTTTEDAEMQKLEALGTVTQAFEWDAVLRHKKLEIPAHLLEDLHPALSDDEDQIWQEMQDADRSQVEKMRLALSQVAILAMSLPLEKQNGMDDELLRKIDESEVVKERLNRCICMASYVMVEKDGLL